MKKIISILLFIGVIGGCASSPTHQEEMQKNRSSGK
jgi:PBP1b-binding outer membrane lipoprotein LpoB